MPEFLPEYLDVILVFMTLFLLGVVLKLSVSVNSLMKQQKIHKIDLRLKKLEDELSVCSIKAQKRLGVFKKVVDGFEHVLKGLRVAIEEEENVECLSENKKLETTEDFKKPEVIELP